MGWFEIFILIFMVIVSIPMIIIGILMNIANAFDAHLRALIRDNKLTKDLWRCL